MTNNIDSVTMLLEFLSQFTADHNWAVVGYEVKNNGALQDAIDQGLVKYEGPPKGWTGYEVCLCTLQGRLYMRKNAKPA